MANMRSPDMEIGGSKRNVAGRLAAGLRSAPRQLAHGLIRAYQLTLSGLIGRHCRYLPSCSAYMDEAIARHGVYAGACMGVARLCRCHPWGNHGFDPVPQSLPADAAWTRPWRYGDWRGPRHCEDVTRDEVLRATISDKQIPDEQISLPEKARSAGEESSAAR